MPRTKRNNFDKSSTGIDIECVCQYDSYKSRMDFEENIEIIQHNGYSTTSIGYYIDNGNVSGTDSVKMTVKGKNEAIIKAAKEYTEFYSDTELDAESCVSLDIADMKVELIAALEDVNIINYALDKLPVIDGLEFVPNKNLIVLTTKGYSQGDYAKVIYCPEDLEKVWGSFPTQESIQKMVDHYYWDSPIYAHFEINGTEYAYHDMPEYNEYEWDRKKFLDYVAKESGVSVESLESFVPACPEYA